MAKISAGILLYRRAGSDIEVLLAHPGGPLWAKKDDASWTIPKGLAEPDEDLLTTAKREFQEETGFPLMGEPLRLEPIRQASGKVIHVWAVEGDCDPATLQSNSFEMEWPPKSGKRCSFPEVDRANWYEMSAARKKILPGQTGFLDQLEEQLRGKR